MRASLNRSEYRVKFYASHIGPLLLLVWQYFKSSLILVSSAADVLLSTGWIFQSKHSKTRYSICPYFRQNMPVPMGEIVEELGADLDARFQPSFPGNNSYLKKWQECWRPKRKKNWTVDLSPVCTWQSPSFTLLLVLYYSFLKSRIAAALVESDATEEQKEEATARYFLNVLWPICSCNVNSILLERCKWFLATPAAGCHILMQGTSKHCEMDWDRGLWLCLGARAKQQVVTFEWLDHWAGQVFSFKCFLLDK